MDLKELMKNGWSYKRCVGGGGGTSIDVTAQVGQTIVVKEVDANGKPTAWESAEYQPRTHWEEYVEFQPETTAVMDEELGNMIFSPSSVPAVGNTYVINYNGTDYRCVARDSASVMGESGAVILGNAELLIETGDTGEPFVIVYDIEMTGMVDFNGATSATLSIKEVVTNPIPEKYLTNAMPYYIDVTTAEDGTMSIKENVYEINAIYNSGRDMILRSVTTETNPNVVWVCRLAQVFGCTYSFTCVADKSIIYSLVLSPQEDGTFQVTY